MSAIARVGIPFLIIGLIIGTGIGLIMPGLMTPISPGQGIVDQIRAAGKIIIGTSSGWPPFEMYNTSSGEFYGFDIDLCELVAKHLNVTIEWRDLNFDLLIGSLTAGSIHMIAAAMFITPERLEQVAFSIPYIRTSEIVVVKSNSTLTIENLTELEGYTVGVQTGTAEDYEIQDLIDAGYDIIIQRYTDPAVLFAALDAGTIDVAYVDEPVFKLYSTLYLLKVIFTVPAPPTALAVRKTDTDLLSVVNTVILNAYASGELDALIEKWFG